MAQKQNAKKGRTYIGITNEINNFPIRMVSQDIHNWKLAIDSARNIFNPRRRLLYEMYENIMLDGHLLSVVNKRIMAITNKRMLFINNDAEKVVSDFIKESILNSPWFYDLRKYAMEPKPFGHSLIELVPSFDTDVIKEVKLIPRFNVKPEIGFIMYDALNETQGIYYRGEKADPYYSQYLIEAGAPKDYGLLMTAAQYVIYKRGGFGDWAQFAELFGMPFRVGKYNPFDANTRKLLEDGLTNMGGAGFAVIPDGTQLEFHNNNGGQGAGAIFKDMIDMCNAEISKIFLGQTMTTDNGSSRSQSEVHKEVEEDINLSDMLLIEYLLNWDFKQKLVETFGVTELENGNFRFDQTTLIPLEQRIDIDLKLSQMGVPMSEEYFYKTYGIAKPDTGETLVVPQIITPQNPSVDEKKKLSQKVRTQLIDSPLTLMYARKCNHAEHNQIIVTLSDSKGGDKIWQRITKEIHDGKIKPGSVDAELYSWIVQQLFAGVTKGFGGDFAKFTEGAEYEMLAHLENNVHVFSAFKTYQELREATDLLTDVKGNIRPFAEFKTDMTKLNEKQNVIWLNAEYNQAIASSQMAGQWVNFSKNKKDVPYLRYETAGDDRVRDSHAALDGIIRKVDDTFWNTYYPPNDWGCRCDVVALVDGTETNISRKLLPTLPVMFETNTAKQGVVFPKKHPYYNVAKEDKQNAKQVWDLPIPDKTKK